MMNFTLLICLALPMYALADVGTVVFADGRGQAHPCDQPSTEVVVQAGTLFGVGFCADPSENDTKLDYLVFIDGVVQTAHPELTKTPVANSANRFYYTTPRVYSATPGLHEVSVRYLGEATGMKVTVGTPTGSLCNASATRMQMTVNAWSALAAPAQYGKVLFSLLSSPRPVVKVQTLLGTVVVDEQTGADLRTRPGVYFKVPNLLGVHKLTVVATDSGGCSLTSTTAMTLTIK